MAARGELPVWVDVAVIPLLNLLFALVVSGLVVLIIGENPLEAMWIMLKGAVGSLKGWGYLLYYATNFVFTGLAVAVAFHAGLFNIGGEGQAYMAGAGAAAVGLSLEFLPWPIVIPLAILASMAVGAFWAWVPGVLQAKRGSHIVITTIMFNFISLSLMGYMINYWFRPVGKMAVESREITGAYIMSFREVAREFFDLRLPSTPLNFIGVPRHRGGLSPSGICSGAPSLATKSAPSAPAPMPPSMPGSGRTASSSSPWPSPARSQG